MKKRMIALLLCFVTILAIAPMSFAANQDEFDYKKVLSKRSGYSYDKFDKYWTWYKAYSREYSDATVVVGLQAYGESGGSNPEYMTLYAKVMNKKGNKMMTVSALDFVLDDDVYSYKAMQEGDNSSSVMLGENGQLFLQALADCEGTDAAVKITMNDGRSISLGMSKEKFTKTLKEFARVATKYDFWGYTSAEWQLTADYYESLYPLTINGKEPGNT